MDRNDYLVANVVAAMSTMKPARRRGEDTLVRTDDDLAEHFEQDGKNIDTYNEYVESANSYLAAAIAKDGEEVSSMFTDNEDLKEVNIEYQLGKHTRVRGIVSREYEDDNGDTIHNHLILEESRENSHIDGVRNMLTAFAAATFATNTEETD